MAIVYIVLLSIFAYRYYNGYPCIEETWTLEFLKYVAMGLALTGICWVIAYVPFNMLASHIWSKNITKD